MEVTEVNAYLGRMVHCRIEKCCIDGDYVLTACIKRRDRLGKLIYQAELLDRRNNSILYADMKDVSARTQKY